MLKTPVTFFNSHTVSHYFKDPGSVVSGLTRIKNASVKCPLSVGTEYTGVSKCSHSQNSKGLKSTDCWPAPREQSVYGHKLAWIFFLVSVKQIQSWSFSKHCRYTPYIYRPQMVLQGVFGARLAVLTRAERTVMSWQWNSFIQNVTHILEPTPFSPPRTKTSRGSNLTVLAYRVILPRILGSRQCRGEFY